MIPRPGWLWRRRRVHASYRTSRFERFCTLPMNAAVRGDCCLIPNAEWSICERPPYGAAEQSIQSRSLEDGAGGREGGREGPYLLCRPVAPCPPLSPLSAFHFHYSSSVSNINQGAEIQLKVFHARCSGYMARPPVIWRLLCRECISLLYSQYWFSFSRWISST